MANCSREWLGWMAQNTLNRTWTFVAVLARMKSCRSRWNSFIFSTDAMNSFLRILLSHSPPVVIFCCHFTPYSSPWRSCAFCSSNPIVLRCFLHGGKFYPVVGSLPIRWLNRYHSNYRINKIYPIVPIDCFWVRWYLDLDQGKKFRTHKFFSCFKVFGKHNFF